ncbi:MAG: hypothetical protein ACKOT0_07160 [bacterium]
MSAIDILSLSIDDFEVTIWQVVSFSIFIGLAAWLSFMVYRAMDHPRLVLTETPQGPRADGLDVAKYALSMPFLIALWWGFFFAVFLINESHINIVQLFVFPSALVVSIRALAFLSPVTARELGKVLPVALVAFVILDGNIRDFQEIDDFLEQSHLIAPDFWVIPFVLFVDYLFTAIWYRGWIRGLQPLLAARKAAVTSAEEVAHDDGGVAVLPDPDGTDRGA